MLAEFNHLLGGVVKEGNGVGSPPWKLGKRRETGQEGQVLDFPVWVCFS